MSAKGDMERINEAQRAARPTNPWQGDINRRLEHLEDELLRIKFREHQHADSMEDRHDADKAAFVRGFQAGCLHACREVAGFLDQLMNSPMPAHSDGDR